jgi:hypothetical protein
MRSFLGVPIVAADGVVGAFYLTEKIDAPDFTGEDEELITLLAAACRDRDRERAPARRRARSRSSRSGTGSRSTCTTPSARSSSGSCSRPRQRRPCSSATRRPPASASAAAGAGAGCARRARAHSSSSCDRPISRRTGSPGALRKARRGACGRLGHEQVELSVSEAPLPDGARDAEVLRIAQEAIQNALRPCERRPCGRQPRRRRGRLALLLVEDDGLGFEAARDGGAARAGSA